MAQINLIRVDNAPIDFPFSQEESEEINFSSEFIRWLANFVSDFNQNMTDIEAELASLDARVTALGG